MFFLNGAFLGILIPYYPAIQQTLHMDAQSLGVSMLFSPLGALLAVPNAGRLISRFGSRNVMLAAGLLLTIEIPLTLAAPTPWLFRLGLLGFGILNSTEDVSMNSQAVTIQHRYHRPMVSSTHGCWSIGGFAGGWAVALASRFAISPFENSALAGVVIGLGTVAAWSKMLPNPDVDLESEPSLALPKGPLLFLGLLTCCAFAAEGASFDWVAVYYRSSLRTSQEVAALGFAAFAVAAAAGRFLGDEVIRRIGNVRTLRYGALASAAGILIAVVSPNPVLAGAGFVFCGLGLANVVPILFRAAGSMEGVSTGYGIASVSACGYFAFFASPPFIGLVADRASLSLALGVVGMLVLVVGLAARKALALTKLREDPTEESPPLPP